jgi:hypothetical protein
MTGERECATGSPITPANAKPTACDMLRYLPSPDRRRAQSHAGCSSAIASSAIDHVICSFVQDY